MKPFFTPRMLGAVGCAAVLMFAARAAEDTSKTSPGAMDKPADNSAQNVRDRSNDSTTPLQQGESKSDVQTTANIRKAVVHDKSLSTNAHNIKIITRDGHVTLRGPVNSDEERRALAAIALRFVDQAALADQLQVKAPAAANR